MQRSNPLRSQVYIGVRLNGVQYFDHSGVSKSPHLSYSIPSQGKTVLLLCDVEMKYAAVRPIVLGKKASVSQDHQGYFRVHTLVLFRCRVSRSIDLCSTYRPIYKGKEGLLRLRTLQLISGNPWRWLAMKKTTSNEAMSVVMRAKMLEFGLLKWLRIGSTLILRTRQNENTNPPSLDFHADLRFIFSTYTKANWRPSMIPHAEI